jgi:hypothetical protein
MIDLVLSVGFEKFWGLFGRLKSIAGGGGGGRNEGANRCPMIVMREEPPPAPTVLKGDTERLVVALLLPSLMTYTVEADGEIDTDLFRDFDLIESKYRDA